MSYSGGIVSAPVNIYDVRNALSASTLNLGALCISNSINKWSKMKPVRSSSINALTLANMSSLAFGLTFNSSGSGDNKYTYNKPRGRGNGDGGSDEWYRLLDFNGYNHTIPSGMVFDEEYEFDTIRNYGSSIVIKTCTDSDRIRISDFRSTIFSGYKAKLRVFELLGTEQYYWESSWISIPTGNLQFTIPWSVISSRLPAATYDLTLYVSNDNGSSMVNPFVADGVLNITSDCGISVSGWGYTMTISGGGYTNSASYWQTGPTTRYLDITGSYFLIQGLPITNNSGRTITNSDIFLYVSYYAQTSESSQVQTHYYSRCRTVNTYNNTSWSLSDGGTSNYTATVLDSEFPKLGLDSISYTSTPVSMYLEARTPINGGSSYVYSRISSVLTINLRRTNGSWGIAI